MVARIKSLVNAYTGRLMEITASVTGQSIMNFLEAVVSEAGPDFLVETSGATKIVSIRVRQVTLDLRYMPELRSCGIYLKQARNTV